jgi:DCN1-like protein 1/2
MGFTQANEKTAIACLTQHDWRLDIASDRFFQNAELYFRDSQPRPVPVDWKKIEQLFTQYRGKYTHMLGNIKSFRFVTFYNLY